MSTARIQTFKQYDSARRAGLRDKYGLPMREINQAFPPRHYYAEWWQQCLRKFEEGCDFTPQHWWRLSDTQGYAVARTSRSLKGPPLRWRATPQAAA